MNKTHSLNTRATKMAALLLAIGSISACSTATPEAGEKSPSASASATATETAEPTATAAPTPSAPPIEGIRVESDKGPYVQAKLPENFPGYVVDPATVYSEATDNYTMDEITSAQKFVVDFIATEGIDSKMNNAGQTAEEWMLEHGDLIAPDFKVEALDSLKGEEYLIMREDWQPEDYDYTYGENTTRVQDLSITPKDIYLSNSGGLAIEMDVSFKMKVDNGTETPELQESYGSLGYSVVHDEKGGWLLRGYQNDMQTIKLNL